MRCRPLMPEWVDARSIHLPPSAAGAGRISPGTGARRRAAAGMFGFDESDVSIQ